MSALRSFEPIPRAEGLVLWHGLLPVVWARTWRVMLGVYEV
jgi:hypothetical protein